MVKARLITVPLAGLGLLLGYAGCAQLVGIEDTNVTVGTGGSGEPSAGGSSGSGSSASGSGGEAGSGGSYETGGSAGSEMGGSGGNAGSAGTDDAGCEEGAGRCSESGRETCTDGAWQAAPCPPAQPTCEAWACIVRGPALVQVGTAFFVYATEVTMGQ